MKKIMLIKSSRVLLVFCFLAVSLMLAFLVGVSAVNADVIPPDTHYVNRCVQVGNIDSSEYALIGYVTDIMQGDDFAYEVEQGQCLDKGYKFNGFDLYAVKKDYLDVVGIEDLEVLEDSNVYDTNFDIDIYGDYVEEANPLIEEIYEYTITDLSDNKLNLFLTKLTNKYNDGSADKITVIALPEQYQEPQVAEAQVLNITNLSMYYRLRGRILLKVEDLGKAYYVNPDKMTMHYLGRPADAFAIMREMGLGISNKDFDFFNMEAPSRLSGKILLKVEDWGKAYYINPVDLVMHYLGRPADAFNIMRELGLGISNTDFEQMQ